MISSSNNPGFADAFTLPVRYYEQSTIFDTASAVSRVENVLGNAAFNLGLSREPLTLGNFIPNIAGRIAQSFTEPDYDKFNPFPQIIGTKYEPHIGVFSKARDQLDVELIKQKLDQEIQDRQTLELAGAQGILPMLFVGNFDPINFIPLGVAMKGARSVKTIALNSLRTSAAFAAATGSQEGLLHSMQELRTKEETQFAVTASLILGAAIGGGVKYMTPSEHTKAADGIYQDIIMPSVIKKDIDIKGDGARSTLSERMLYGNKILQGEKLTEADNLKPLFEPGVYFKKEEIEKIEDIYNRLDQQIDPPIVPVSSVKEVSSILLPKTILDVRKKLFQVYNAQPLQSLKMDVLTRGDITFTGLDYLEAEFRSFAHQKLSPQEIDEIFNGIIEMGISKSDVDKILKNLLREATGISVIKEPVTQKVTKPADVPSAQTLTEPLEPEPVVKENLTTNTVRQAIIDLTGKPDQRLRIAELRKKLSDMPRKKVDAALREMKREGRIMLFPDEDRSKITQADKDAALKESSRTNHIIMMPSDEFNK